MHSDIVLRFVWNTEWDVYSRSLTHSTVCVYLFVSFKMSPILYATSLFSDLFSDWRDIDFCFKCVIFLDWEGWIIEDNMSLTVVMRSPRAQIFPSGTPTGHAATPAQDPKQGK